MKKKINILSVLMIIGIFLPMNAMGGVADGGVNVYLEGAYTSSDLVVYVYADITGAPILSSGVKLSYNASDLTVVSAEKNEAVWYMGDGAENVAYMDPETETPGEIIIIGGKLDINNPTAGVIGDRVLLGKVTFSRITANPPTVSISLGRGGSFANFVTIDGNVLDEGILFGEAQVVLLGDANTDGNLTTQDMFAVKDLISSDTYKCFADCNGDGIISTQDMFCIKGSL